MEDTLPVQRPSGPKRKYTREKRHPLTADQIERLQALFETSSATSIRSFLDTIRDAKRSGSRWIKAGETFTRPDIVSFFEQYEDKDREAMMPTHKKARRRGFGDRKQPTVLQRPKEESSIWVPAPRMQFQIDLKDLKKWKYGVWRYTIGCIDVNSRYAMVVPLKFKKESELKRGFFEIIEHMGVPERLNGDREFDMPWVKQWANENDVQLFFSNPKEYTNKNAIIEAFWQPWAKIVKKWLVTNPKRSKDWLNAVPELVEQYNDHKHFTTHEKPADVFEGRAANRQTIVVAPRKFSEGDLVRILEKPETFRRATDRVYSDQTYRLVAHGPLTEEAIRPTRRKIWRRLAMTPTTSNRWHGGVGSWPTLTRAIG